MRWSPYWVSLVHQAHTKAKYSFVFFLLYPSRLERGTITRYGLINYEVKGSSLTGMGRAMGRSARHMELRSSLLLCILVHISTKGDNFQARVHRRFIHYTDKTEICFPRLYRHERKGCTLEGDNRERLCMHYRFGKQIFLRDTMLFFSQRSKFNSD